MKKRFIFLLLLLVSLILTPLSFEVNASNEEELKIDTYYPKDVLDYADLTDIKHFSISENYIAYTLDNTNLTIYNKTLKQTSTISNFTNIKLIRYAFDYIIVVDEYKIYIINDYSKNTTSQLTVLKDNLPTLNTVDIYSNSNKSYIGYIYNDTFELLEYSNETILTGTPTNTEIYTSGYFLNAYMMALNNNNAYIVYSTNPLLNGMFIQNLVDNSFEQINNFISYAKLIDTFYYNSLEYIVTFTDESLFFLDNNLEKKQEIKIGTTIDIDNNIFPILSLSDFDFYNNSLFVSDTYYKTIQSFALTTEEEDNVLLKSDNILLCGNNQAKGRFNSVNNIYIQGNTIFTSDTNNNRIQILTPSDTSTIPMESNYTSPTNICRDSNNNLYAVAKNNESYKILKYRYNNNKYFLEKSISPSKSTCKISSTTLVGDTLYALDYINNEVIYLNNDSTSLKCKFTDSFDLLENSKIEYIKKLNLFIILNNNQITLHNTNGEVLDFINLNCKDITVGLSEIYALSNDKITLINITDNTLVINNEKTISSDKFADISTISYDIINNKMYAFNNVRSCLEFFDCNLVDKQFIFNPIDSTNLTTIDNTPYFYELTYNPIIYTNPYNLGDYYSNENISHAIAIETYGDFIRILFNDNGDLKEGFVNKYRCTKLDYEYNVTKVIAINDLVPVYKYPTLLKLDNSPIVYNQIPIYTKITLTHTCPANIDGKTFYMFQMDGNVGFLYSQDLILDSSKNITNLNNENATIKAYDNNSIKLLAEDKSTAIQSLPDGTRIYVEEYDKHSEYTKVIYKDSSLKTYEGYVETKYIEMDKMDLSKIILITLISISVVILIVILIVYISLKKKK